jgi:pimeloyl-ACP methyl ester carboxylesterase
VALKALLITSPDMQNRTDKTAPVIISCHGLGDNYLAYMDLYYLLARKGYVVVAPEFRGHGSNPAPLTLGIMEPLDIITWLDFVGTNIACANSSNAGFYGFSMGGYYATMAYILESTQAQRVHALVEIAGFVNVSREISYVTNDPTFFGPLPVLQNVTEKNAVNYVNSTFPRNVMIMHGDADNTVDVQCSYDFIAALDPYKNRTDIAYYIRPGQDHGDVGFNTTTFRMAASWFDKYLLNKTSVPSEMYMPTNPVSSFNGFMIYWWCLGFCVSGIFLVGSLVYVVKPKLFFRKGNPEREFSLSKLVPSNIIGKSNFTVHDGQGTELNSPIDLIREHDLHSNSNASSPGLISFNNLKYLFSEFIQNLKQGIKPIFRSNGLHWKDRLLYLGILFSMIFLAGACGYWFNQTILVKLGFFAISLLFGGIICGIIAQKKGQWPQIRGLIDNSLNYPNGLLFSLIILVWILGFLLFESNPTQINLTLGPGARFTPLFPLLFGIFICILGCSFLFVRLFVISGYATTYSARLIVDVVYGAVLSLNLGLFFVWNTTTLFWDSFIFNTILSISFWGGSVMALLLHFFERIHKSILPFIVFLAVAVAVGIGSSPLYLIF